MNQSDENERFCLDNLSDCSVSSLETDNSNSSEESDLNPQKRRRTFPLQRPARSIAWLHLLSGIAYLVESTVRRIESQF
ncbi:hypothetical protein KM043_013470 [Ampulex compressa]|nr:hypothetical protein KM043_013470 [Ampulex compressa]